MKRFFLLVGSVAVLSGCVFRHEVKDLDPQAGRPPLVVEKKISGKVAIAIVDNLSQPLVIRSRKISGRMIGGDQEVTLHVGEPLKKAVAAALREAAIQPTFVESEDQARAMAGQGTDAIIVRYTGATGTGEMRESGFGWVSWMNVNLSGEVILIARNAEVKRQPVSAFGSDRKSTFSLSWYDHATPAPKAATEQAINSFALSVVSEATSALAK